MEKPPSFSNFTFNTIKKNSLLSRLSAPFRQVQTPIVDSGQDDGDNSSVDMDVDSDSNELQTALTDTSSQPNLLARLSGSTAASAGSSMPSSNQHGTTSTHPFNPAQPTNLSQVASNLSDQTKRSGSPKSLDSAEAQNGAPMTPGISDNNPPISGANTSIIADNNTSACSSPLFNLGSLATPASTGLPTPPPSGSAMLLSDAELPTHVTTTPARGAASTSPFPSFVYTPLTQLLQEELAAWSEVWAAKRNQAGESRVDLPSAPFRRDKHPKPSQPDPFVSACPPPLSAVHPEARTGDKNSIPTVPQSAVPITKLHSTASPVSGSVAGTCLERSGKPNVETKNAESSCKLLGSSRNNANSISSMDTSSANAAAQLCSPKRSAVPPGPELAGDQASTTCTQDRSTLDSKVTAVEPSRERPLGDKTIQVSAKPSGSYPASPREDELKALLKSRRAPSDMSLSTTPQNEERTLHTSRSMHSTPDARDVNNRDSQQSAPSDRSTRPTSSKVPQRSPELTTENVSAPAGAPVPVDDNRVPESVSPHSEDGHPTKRKVSASQPLEKDLVQKGKKQKTAGNGSPEDVPDSRNERMSQPVVGSENATTHPPNVAFKTAPTLPPRPTFLSSGHKTSTSTTDATRSSLKRTRSPIVKTEDGGVDSKLGPSSSRPMKRVKVEEATNDVKVKKEEEEDVKVPGLTAAAAQTTHRGSSHIPMNIVPNIKEEVRSIEGTSLATAMQTLGESSRSPIGQGQSENTRALPTPAQANSGTLGEQTSSTTSDSDSIGARAGTGSPMQNQVSGSTSQDPVSQHESLGQRPELLERITLQTRAISLHPHGTEATVFEPPMSDGNLCDMPDRGHTPVVSQQDCPMPPSNSATLASRLAISDSLSSGQSSSGQRTPQSGSERRMADEDVLRRGRSQGRQPIVDHWSPTRPYSPDRPRAPHVADTYRPNQSISPKRSPRTSFDNRRYRDRERTPPRYSWRNRQRSSSRGRPPLSFRYSRSRSPSPRRGRPVYPRLQGPPRSRRWDSRSRSPPPRRPSPRRERYFDSQSRPSRWDTEVPSVADSHGVHALNGGPYVREGATRPSRDDTAFVVSPNTANGDRRQIAEQSNVQRIDDGSWPSLVERRQPANGSRADAYRSDRGVTSIKQPSFPMPPAYEIQTIARPLQERADSSHITVQRLPDEGSVPYQRTEGSQPSHSAGQPHMTGGMGSSRGLYVAAGTTGTFGPSATPVNAGSSSLHAAAPDQSGLLGRTVLPSEAQSKNTDSQQPCPLIQRYRYVEPAEPVAPANNTGPRPTSESVRQDKPSHLQSKGEPTALANDAGLGRTNGSVGRDKPPHMQGKAGSTASANNANPRPTSETIRQDKAPRMQNKAQPKQREKNNSTDHPTNNTDSGPMTKSIKRDEPPHMQSKALSKQQGRNNTVDRSLRRNPHSKPTSFPNDPPIPPGLSTINVPEHVAPALPAMPPQKIEIRQIPSSKTPNAPPIRVSDPFPILSGRQENAPSAPHAESQTSSNQARERLDDIPKKHESLTSRNLADRISDESNKPRTPQKRRDYEPPRLADSTESRNIDLVSRIEGPAEMRQPKPLASRMTDNSAEPALVSRFQDFSLKSLPRRPPSPCHLPANSGKGRGISRPSPPRIISSPILLGRMQSPEREVDQQREPRHAGRGGAARGRGRGQGQGSAQNSPGGARHPKSSSKPALEERFS